MFKLYRNFKKQDWVFVALIMGLTVLQVYCSMTLIDFLQSLIKSIQFLNYHNNPAQIGDEFYAVFVLLGQDDASRWAALAAMDLSSLGLDASSISAINSIAVASTGEIWYYGGLMIGCAAGVAACQALISGLASFVAADLATYTRSRINEKVSSFSLAEISRFSTASLITRTTNDIENVQMTSLLMMRMVFAAPVTAVWAICKIQASSWQLTVVTAVGIAALVIGLSVIMALVLPKFKINQKLLDRLNGITRENLNGIRVVRAFNAEDYQEKKFADVNEKETKVQIFTGRVLSLMNPLMMILMNGISLAIYWVGATLINGGELDYATLTAFMMLATQIIMAFVMLLMMFIMWPRASVSAKRINEVLETKIVITDPKEPIVPVEKGSIAFKDVNFGYPDASDNVLQHISFEAKEGETIAFIGSTGSGKSTLVNLITRLYDVTSGAVTINGVDVRSLRQSYLRSVVGFVPQKGLLFSGSVASNVRFGAPSISDDEVKKACQIACADGFISEMEGGYGFVVSQGGTNVSGGQRQRLCIARAVAIKPQFLVFDDSFSALDYKTDRQVRDNLAESEAAVTKIIVAQRIGTIMDADRIVVLDSGKMVGCGKHEELLRTCPIYREIALSQLTKEELGL
ncbi:MAG: ABC transporter ATP-binding protein/permease [Bacilli bacterium]|jgi:ATP-binding cassette subfamily B protein|nr:ABC transporter ATP-binding protein/permease [Bacilli bacterium]